MDLQDVVNRYAEAVEYIDLETDVVRANPRTGEIYQTSFKSLSETKAVDAIDAVWSQLHPDDLSTPANQRVGIKYPAVKRAKCDHVFSTVPIAPGDQEEWGIEIKKIEFFGNNGKRNDFGVGKMLSPYLKDRGLLHDAARLRQYGFTQRVAVVGYAFDYTTESLDRLETMHPQHAATISESRAVVRLNGGVLESGPLVEFTDSILRIRGFTKGPRAEAHFEAFRHPTGGPGVFFGWEVRRPWLEKHYDARHPW